MKALKKYTAVLASVVITVAILISAAQASGKAYVNLVPAVIVSVDDYHKSDLYNNKRSHYINKRNNDDSKNVYKTNYRANNSDYSVKRGFTSKIVNSGRSFHLNSKEVIRKLR